MVAKSNLSEFTNALQAYQAAGSQENINNLLPYFRRMSSKDLDKMFVNDRGILSDDFWNNFGKQLKEENLSQIKELIKSTGIAEDTIGNLTVSYGKLTNKTLQQALETSNLTDAQKTQVVQTFAQQQANAGLSFSFKALAVNAKAALLAMAHNPLTWVMVAVTAISALANHFEKVRQEQEELRQTTAENAKEYQEQAKSLEEYKEQVNELRTELDYGNLSEGEAYDKRKELLEIQEKLVESYGKEAEGVNLVTGELKEQTEALDNLTKQKWQDWVQENKKGIDQALEDWIDPQSYGPANSQITQSLTTANGFGDKVYEELKNQLGDDAEILGQLFNSGEFMGLSLNTAEKSADEIEELYRTLYNTIESVGKTVFSDEEDYSRYVDGLLSGLSATITEFSKQANSSRATLDTFMDGELRYNEKYSDIYAKILTAKADYEDAIANDDSAGVEKALEDMKATEQAWKDAGWDSGEVNKYVEGIFNDFNAAAAREKVSLQFEAKVNGEAPTDFVKRVERDLQKFADDRGRVDLVTLQADGQFGTEDQIKAYSDLKGAAEETGITIEQLQSILVENGLVVDSAATDSRVIELKDRLADLRAELQRLYSYQNNGGILDLDKIRAVETEIGNVRHELEYLGEGKGISDVLSFSVSESENVSDAIEGVQGKISSLSEALEKLGDGTLEIEDVISLLGEFPELGEYVDLTAENFGNLDVGLRKVIKDSPNELIETLRKFQETNELTEDASSLIDGLCDSLTELPTEATKNLSEEFGLVADSIRDAKQAKDELDKALEEEDYDEGYEKRVESFTALKESFEKGEVGSKAVQAYKKYFGIEGYSYDELKQWLTDFERYFPEEEDSKEGLWSFLNDIARLGQEGGALDGIASYENGVLDYDITKLDEFAKALKMPTEMLQDFLDKYRMYSDDFLSRDAGDNLAEFTEAGAIDGTSASLKKLREITGLTKEDVTQLIDEINDLQTKNKQEKIKLIDDDDTALKEWKGWLDGEAFQGSAADDLSKALDDIGVSVEKIKDEDSFDDVLKPLLQDMEWTSSEIDDLKEKLYGPFQLGFEVDDPELSAEDLQKRFEAIKIPITLDGENLKVTQETIDGLIDAGATAEQVKSTLTDLLSRGDVAVPMGLKLDGVSLDGWINETKKKLKSEVEMSLPVTVDNETVTVTVNTVKSALTEAMGDGWEIPVSSKEAEEKISSVGNLLESLPPDTPLKVSDDSLAARNNLRTVKDILGYIDRNSNKTITVTYVSNKISKNAKGTKDAKAGLSLLGDEYSPDGSPKPELVVSGDSAYLAGTDGPTVGYLEKGDVVYSNRETKKILGNKGFSGKIPAFAGGGNHGGPGGSAYIPGNIGGNSGSNGTSGDTVTVQATLDSTDLEEQLKDTLEELEKELEKLLSNFEHQIFLLEKKNGSTAEIVAYYRKMQEAVHAQAEKYRQLGLDGNSKYIQELQRQWYEYRDNIQEAIAADFEKRRGELENAVTLAEDMRGVADSRDNHTGFEAYSNNMIAYYREMQDQLHQQAEYYRSLGYSETSDEISGLRHQWREYANAIEDVRQEVIDDLLDMASAASELVDKAQDLYDTLHNAADEYAETGYISVDVIQDILNLEPQYLKYLTDENGQLTINEESINKLTAARTRQMAVETALAYVERLRLALEGKSGENIDELIGLTEEATNATKGLAYAQLSLLKPKMKDNQYQGAVDYLDKIFSLADNAIAGIGIVGDNLDKMKGGIGDLIEYVISMLEQQNQDQIDALEKMKDEYSDLIALKKESLQASKDEADYEKDKTERLKEITKLQARIDALSLAANQGDRKAQAERDSLLEELFKLQEDLAGTQADHALEAQQDALDKMEEAYHEEKDAEIKELEDKLSSYEKKYDLAVSHITERWKTGWGKLLEELTEWNHEHGSDLRETLEEAWRYGEMAAQHYGGIANAIHAVHGGGSSGGNSGGDVGQSSVIGEAKHDHSSTNEEKIHAVIRSMYRNTQEWPGANKKRREDLDAENLVLGNSLSKYGVEAIRDEASGVWYIDRIGGEKLYEKYRKYCYHTGGFAGDAGTLKDNEILAKLEKGEPVLTKRMWGNLTGIIERMDTLSNAFHELPGYAERLLTGSNLKSAESAVSNIINNSQPVQISIGDTNIYGDMDRNTVERHITVTRDMVNQIARMLKISL